MGLWPLEIFICFSAGSVLDNQIFVSKASMFFFSVLDERAHYV